MCKVISIANQKGGTSKTTTTVNLGIGLSRLGNRVLVIDNDPQGSMTVSLGYPHPDELDFTLSTVLQSIIFDDGLDFRNNEWRQRVNDFDILSDAHDSLKKLKTDCIDIYMLHRDNKDAPVGKIVDVMNRLYDEGKIKVFGGSNWTHQRIEEANEYAMKHNLQPFSVSSPNFGLAEQVADPWRCDARFGDGCVTISGPQNASAREWYGKNNISVFAYSSLARGFFSGFFSSENPEKAKEIMDEPGIIGYYCERNIERLKRCEILSKEKGLGIAQIAMAWIYNQNFDVFAISSPANIEQAKQNIKAMNEKLSDDECRWLDLEDRA